MSRAPLLFALLLTACSKGSVTASPTPTASATPSTPVAAAPSTDALAAKAQVERYFDLMRAGRYADAHALWTPVVGKLGPFVAVSRRAGRFDGHAGPPSEIREADGERFVLVEATATATPPGGKAERRDGVVMLRRPAGEAGAWRIWGTDIRPRRCKAGQEPRGLGCVPLQQN